MLEEGDHLRTWKLLESPEIFHTNQNEKPNISIKAQTSFDHRPIYLDYEGPISGNRGSVKRIEQGTFEWIEKTDEKILITLQGQKIKGLLKLMRIKTDEPKNRNKAASPVEILPEGMSTSNKEDPDDWQLKLLPLSVINQLDALNS